VAVGSRVPLVSAAALVSMAVPLILYAIARSTFHEGVRAVAALDR
jgi:ABC-type glycerol-3-phosphate transport system permease component